MDLFQYRYGYAAVLPRDDELVRILITSDHKNNVTVWYGYDFKAAQYTLSRDAISKIRSLISKQDRLFEDKKLDSDDASGYHFDIPMHYFSLTDAYEYGEVNFASQMMDSEHVAKSNIDLMVDLVYGIQEIMQKDGVDVTIWKEGEFLRFKD